MSQYTIDLDLYPDCRSLVEQASALIQTGKTPHIETPGVTFSVRSKQPFKNHRMKIYQLFRDPSYAVGTCLHEAAHAVVLEEDGVPNNMFFGPAIQYDRVTKTLFPSGARIEPGKERKRIVDAALIFERTTQLVVGGVALEKYAGIKEVSDAKDYDDFKKKYATMPDDLRNEKPDDLWKRARENASSRLDSPETKMKVFEKASEYLPLLYP